MAPHTPTPAQVQWVLHAHRTVIWTLQTPPHHYHRQSNGIRLTRELGISSPSGSKEVCCLPTIEISLETTRGASPSTLTQKKWGAPRHWLEWKEKSCCTVSVRRPSPCGFSGGAWRGVSGCPEGSWSPHPAVKMLPLPQVSTETKEEPWLLLVMAEIRKCHHFSCQYSVGGNPLRQKVWIRFCLITE